MTDTSSSQFRRFASLLWVALVAFVGVFGCDRNVGTIDLFFLTPEGEDPFASVDSLFIRIAIDGEIPHREELLYIPGEEMTVPEITVGKGWTVSVSGETNGGALLSRGRSLPFKVVEGHNRLDLYFAPLSERAGFSKAAKAVIPGTARGGHVAVELVDGRVLLIGGGSTFAFEPLLVETPIRAVDIFDPTTGQIVEAGQCSLDTPPGSTPLCLLSPRVQAAFGRTVNGDVLVVGGKNDDAMLTSVERLPRGERNFVAVETALTRFDASLVQTDFGALLLGGRSGEGVNQDYFTMSGVRFDEHGGYETEYEAILRRGRDGAAIATVSSHGGQIFVFSGYGYEQTILTLLSSYEVVSLSPVSGVSEPLKLNNDPELLDETLHINPRSGAVATAIDDRFILVTGGRDAEGQASGEIDLFDYGTGFFCMIGEMAVRRHLHAAAPLLDGSVLVVGGIGGTMGNSPLAQVEIIDLGTAMTKMRDGLNCSALRSEEVDVLVDIDTLSLPDARFLPTVTALANDMVLISGGFGSDGNAVGQHLLWVQ